MVLFQRVYIKKTLEDILINSRVFIRELVLPILF